MVKGGTGGWKTKSGKKFEKKVDLRKSLIEEGYKVRLKRGETKSKFDRYLNITKDGESVGKILTQNEFHIFLKNNGIDIKDYMSHKLIPDFAIIYNGVCHIIEVKYQNVPSSADEKLQTSHFKKSQYQKVLKELNLDVTFTFILNDFFKEPKYKDVLEYIKEIGDNYFFNQINAKDLGF